VTLPSGPFLEAVSEDPALTGRRVLVTGGGGFIGSHLVDALVGHNEVRVLDDFSGGSRERVHPEADVVEGDVRDPDAVETAMADVDVVFHQAGLVSVAASTERPVDSQSANVGGTMQVLDAARRRDARAVVASSAAVYGRPGSVPIAEDASLSPTSPYGVDKLAIDHYTRLFADLYDLPTVALRYFNVYGPGQPGGDYSGVIRTFVDQARSGEPITVHGDGEQTRDFVHVADVVRANVRAALTDDVGAAYNVATGDAVTINELARRVRAAADSESRIVNVDPRPGDIRHSRADTTAAAEGLGFQARVSLAEGLPTVPGLSSPER